MGTKDGRGALKRHSKRYEKLPTFIKKKKK